MRGADEAKRTAPPGVTADAFVHAFLNDAQELGLQRHRQFAHLVDKLSTIQEGEGTMLDHSLFLYGTGISDSNTHSYDDLPIAIVGGRGAGVQGGRYVRYPQGTPLANLHLTLLDKLGIAGVTNMGDSTGPIDLLSIA